MSFAGTSESLVLVRVAIVYPLLLSFSMEVHTLRYLALFLLS